MLRPLLVAAIQAAPPSPSTTVTTGTPSVTDLPGSSVLNTLTNGIEAWALIAAVVGIVIGAVTWGSSQHAVRKAIAV